jgi:hypothetical protein
MDDFTIGMVCVIALAASLSAIGLYVGLKT